MFGTIGVQEMMVIFIVALVLFGPKKLPELGKTIGKAITEFRRASSELKSTFEQQMQTLERETESLKDAAHEVNRAVETQNYEHPYYDATSQVTDPYDSAATNPTTVSASEVPGAESQGAAETATQEPAAEAKTGVEGTVPRTEPVRIEEIGDFGSHLEQNPSVETPQHG